jgi:phosphoglycolate phosphatase-like HAD superfamily hydrolase
LPFQFCFALDELKRLASQNPEWKKNELLAAAMSGDMDVIKTDLKSGLIAVLSATHAGMTTACFQNRVTAWMKQAKHFRYQRRYSDLAYNPMLKVLSYLQANGFKTYIVSGAGIDFMRAWSEDGYGIPPQQVIGSQAAAVCQVNDGAAEIVKQWQLDFVDGKEGKPIGIYRHIGRRPIICLWKFGW